jgi:phage-related minor tail protein
MWATFNNEQVQKDSEASAGKWAAIEKIEKEAAEKQMKIQKDLEKERERQIKASSQFFSDRFADAFMDFANGAKTAKDAFRDMTVSLLQDMAKILAKQALLSIVSGIFSSVGGSGGTGFASIFGLAGGGTAQAGRPYVVGEKGPELFVPDRTGTVVPNGAGGSSNTVVTVNVDASGNSNLNNENSAQMGRMIANSVNDQVKKALIKESRYGGILNQRATAMRGV